MIFRDQSKNVIPKAKAQEAKGHEKRLDSDSALLVFEEAGVQPKSRFPHPQWQPLGDIFTLNPTFEDRATCYIVSNYVFGITVPRFGDFNNQTVMFVATNMDTALFTSVKAASLASYGYYVRSSDLLNASRYEYTKAIRPINSALANPTNAIKDSTLLAVNLLGLYEILTGQNQRSMEAWAEHARGAATLIKLCGQEQFSTPLGRRIFVQATINMVTSCLQRGIRLPEHVVEMTETLAELTDGMNPGVDVLLIMLKLNQFRCDIKDRSINDLQTIVDRAIHLDEGLAVVCDSHPSEWRYDTFINKKSRPDIVFNGSYHVYANTWAASLWNMIRVIGILIRQDIRDILLEGFSTRPPTFTEPEHISPFQISTDLCYKMQADILASVPQALGYITASDS